MYYAGIDLGTSSIGWALTDENYNLIRKKGKDLWGVRLFDEASTAQERRNFRTARRRRQREVARIGLLKAYFSDAIDEVDSGFFQRLEESKYHYEDKRIVDKYAIFADKNYTDKEYYAQYPTIFHLRKDLLQTSEKKDVRLVYLAILNLFKHRGHFLNASLGEEAQTQSLKEIYVRFCNSTPEIVSSVLSVDQDCDEMLLILCDRSLSKREKTEKLVAVFGLNKNLNKADIEIIKMVCGLSGKLSNIFGKELFGEEQCNIQLSFRENGYEEKVLSLTEILPDECIGYINTAKEIHDYALLNDIMKDCKYLSEARVKSYEKHKADLKKLQYVIKKYAGDSYDDYFRVMSDNNYSGYVGSVNSNKEKRRRNRKASQEAFFKETKRLLSLMPEEDEDVLYIKNELEKETFLPKQLSFENGVIPNQVHLMELKKILSNAEKYLPFLKDTDESGLTVSERIIQLFKFQIPYYVGPLNDQNGKSKNCWIVRKEHGKIFPWNLEEKVDMEETRRQFIMRMVRNCTYLSGEKCLPKNSILYEQYMVLNELNNLKIHGVKIEQKIKQDIYHVLFKKGKKVTRKDLVNYLVSNGHIRENEQDEISGIDGDFQQALVSYGRFRSVLGDKIDLCNYQKMAEQIIFWGTVYSNDKKIMKQLIDERYGENGKDPLITNAQIKRILGFKWKDWGKFSREFLELRGCSKADGEILNIIDALWEYSDNLMELLGSRYTYIDVLKEKTTKIEKILSDFSYEDLDNMYCSAPVKRMIWQTILIMKEICQVMGEPPKKIFVEMPRTAGEKGKRTVSRKKKFEDLYKQCGKEFSEWQKEISNLSENDFYIKKLYLYYTQMGRCMYSGEAIQLDKIEDYDIDHIYPRHFVKDDSLDNNLVLVKKQINNHKQDKYPLEDSIRKSRYTLWKNLLDRNMITPEKFKRLTRSWEFTDEELAAFINRQIVETGQATKLAAQILEDLLPKSEVVYVKAGNVSDFRYKKDLLKSRVMNDFHHAKDAYLNIVVGNVYDIKFTKNPMNFVKEYHRDARENSYHMDKIFDYDVQRNGVKAWKTGGKGTIAIIRKTMERNTPLITKRTCEKHGGIAEQTIYSAKEANMENYISIKSSDERMCDVTKYGGFSSIAGAYYFLVEHEKKGKKVRTLEQFPIYMKKQMEVDEKILIQYCVETLGLRNPNIRWKKIPFKALVKRDGYYLNLAGRTGNQIMVENAMPLCLTQNWSNYIKHLENFHINGKEEDLSNRVTNERNIELYEQLLNKHQTVYLEKPNSLAAKLVQRKDAFGKLKLSEQVNVLLEILKVTQCKNIPITCKELDMKASPMKIGKEVGKSKEFLLINQSVTGIYESVIDLKTV